MMYMQSYMGLPYAAGGIPGQMYNNTTGYPAQQSAAIASKAPYNAQNPNKVRDTSLLISRTSSQSDTCHRNSSNMETTQQQAMAIRNTANRKPHPEPARFHPCLRYLHFDLKFTKTHALRISTSLKAHRPLLSRAATVSITPALQCLSRMTA
jgi:hypothetical protein